MKPPKFLKHWTPTRWDLRFIPETPGIFNIPEASEEVCCGYVMLTEFGACYARWNNVRTYRVTIP